MKEGTSLYSTRSLCKSFRVSQDIGIGILFWMYRMYHIQIPGFEGSLPNKYMSLYVLIFESIPTINNPLDDTLSLLVCLTSYHSSRLFLSLFQGTSTLAAEVDRKSGISRLHPLILGIHSIKHLFSGTYHCTNPTPFSTLPYPALPFSTLPYLSLPYTTLPFSTRFIMPYPTLT